MSDSLLIFIMQHLLTHDLIGSTRTNICLTTKPRQCLPEKPRTIAGRSLATSPKLEAFLAERSPWLMMNRPLPQSRRCHERSFSFSLHSFLDFVESFIRLFERLGRSNPVFSIALWHSISCLCRAGNFTFMPLSRIFLILVWKGVSSSR